MEFLELTPLDLRNICSPFAYKPVGPKYTEAICFFQPSSSSCEPGTDIVGGYCMVAVVPALKGPVSAEHAALIFTLDPVAEQ